MTLPYESKTEKSLREARQALAWKQDRETRLNICLNAIESLFLAWKHRSHSALFGCRKREYANNAMSMYKEWQQTWSELLETKACINELSKNVKKYEIKIQKTKEYNERRRKRRTEKKQVRQ